MSEKHHVSVAGLLPVLLLGSCTKTLPQPEPCPLSWDGLVGTEWLFLRANPSGSSTPDVGTRLRLWEDGGTLRAKYNVGSLSDMYDYTCGRSGEELVCKTAPDVTAWCLSMLVTDQPCTDAWLLAEEPTLTADEIAAGRAAAQEILDEHLGTPTEAQLRLVHNNLGNKLRGVLYIKIDTQRCRLHVSDMYRTAYDGRWLEDSNPVGTNPFVSNVEGPLLWEHCGNTTALIAQSSPDTPTSSETESRHPVGVPVHYWLTEPSWFSAEDGCDYRFDLWFGARPAEADLAPEIVDGQLRWHFSRTFSVPTSAGTAEVSTMITQRTCGKRPPEREVFCNGVRAE